MEPWHYDTAQDLDATLAERLRRFPREPDMFVYGLRAAGAVLIRSWLRTYHRLTVIGGEHLPTDGGSFVLVANHASHLDAPCIQAALPLDRLHRVFPAAATDYFFVSVRRLAFAAIVINALPFDREVHVRQSLSLCRELLANPGNVLILFPEGSRSASGEVGEFKPGVGLLLAGCRVPVVPCYLRGADAAWRKGAWLPRPRRIELRIGRPRTYEHLKRSRATCEGITDELRQAVLELADPGPDRTPDASSPFGVRP